MYGGKALLPTAVCPILASPTANANAAEGYFKDNALQFGASPDNTDSDNEASAPGSAARAGAPSIICLQHGAFNLAG